MHLWQCIHEPHVMLHCLQASSPVFCSRTHTHTLPCPYRAASPWLLQAAHGTIAQGAGQPWHPQALPVPAPASPSPAEGWALPKGGHRNSWCSGEALCQPSPGISNCSAEPPCALSGWRRAELVNLQISGKPSGERVQRKGCQVHIKVSSNCTTANPLLALSPLDGSVPCPLCCRAWPAHPPNRGQAKGAPRGLHHCWPEADGHTWMG